MLFARWWTGGYLRMVKAGSDGRWEEALRRIAALERSSLGRMIPASDFALRRATAFYALGREPEAWVVLSAFEETEALDWVWHARLSKPPPSAASPPTCPSFSPAPRPRSPEAALEPRNGGGRRRNCFRTERKTSGA